MSLILDALRKSDRERTRQASERLREGPGTAAPNTAPVWLLGVLITGLLLLAIALLVIVMNPVTPPADRETGNTTGAKPEIMENGPTRAAIRPLGAELAPAPRAARAMSRQQDSPHAANENAPGIDDLNAVPFESLPPEIRAQLPRLHVDIHAWSEDARARFVLINLQRYQEGDRLPEGPLVRRILPDGVVLDTNGTLFSLPRQ